MSDPASSPLPISVTLIASNEAHNLPRVLRSVHGWVKEIVVVLNDCTDESRAVAESFDAMVHEHPWHGHRDQKNIALDYATQPWVLALDADEEVTPALAARIRAFLGSESRAVGARFPRRTWFLGRWIRHGDWYPDYQLRLFRREKARWGGSTEHDKIVLDGDYATIRCDLLHHSFPDLSTQVRKIAYFSDIFLDRQLDEERTWSLGQTIFRPCWRFFRAYVLRCGFLDGFPGLYIAVATAFFAFVRYSRLYEYRHNPAVRARVDAARKEREPKDDGTY